MGLRDRSNMTRSDVMPSSITHSGHNLVVLDMAERWW